MVSKDECCEGGDEKETKHAQFELFNKTVYGVIPGCTVEEECVRNRKWTLKVDLQTLLPSIWMRTVCTKN
jgi:hypothetical protein